MIYSRIYIRYAIYIVGQCMWLWQLAMAMQDAELLDVTREDSLTEQVARRLGANADNDDYLG